MSVWHYLKNGTQYGPVELHELKQLAADGTILPTDMIWKEGLPEWVAASKAKGLFPEPGGAVPQSARAVPSAQYQVPAASYQAPAAAPYAAPAQVGYYAAASSLPARAAQTLRMMPPPSGSTQDWPLDDARLRQLQTTGRHRRTIVLMSHYFRLMFFYGGIISSFVLAMLITEGVNSSRTLSRILSEPQVLIPLILLFGSTICAGVAYGATQRAQAWAPITMLAVHGALVLYSCYGLFKLIQLVSDEGASAAIVLIPALMWTIWMIAGCYFCYRAIVAIPQFLAQPVWCQEALVASHL